MAETATWRGSGAARLGGRRPRRPHTRYRRPLGLLVTLDVDESPGPDHGAPRTGRPHRVGRTHAADQLVEGRVVCAHW
jgi:hypothetical protein